MILDDFTEKDFDLLLDALDAWEKQPSSEGFSSSLIKMIGRKDQDSSERTMRLEIDEMMRQSTARKRVAILLRAKIELTRQKLQSEGIAAAKGEG